MTPRQILIYWLWAVAIAVAIAVMIMPAPVADGSKLKQNRADEDWRISRLETTTRNASRNAENLSELARSNLWGGQFANISVDESAKRWRIAGVAGQARDRVVLVQFGDDRILPLKVGEKFPDGTPIVEIKENGVCVNIDGKKRLLPLAEQTIPIVW